MATDSGKARKAVKWLGIWMVWTLFALFFASQFALQNQFSRNPVSFWQILLWQMVSGYIWFAISPLILFLADRFPFDGDRWKRSLSVHLVACVVIAFVQLAVDAFVLTRLGYPPNREFANFGEAYRFFVFVNLHLSILIYWGVVGIKSTFGYYQKYRERELRTSQLEARLAQSRLHMLKTQLQPHFLFNTLNDISELIHRDPDAADRMITELSDLLRISFQNLEVEEVSLAEELDFLKKYLAIEQMRFRERLKITIDADAETLGANVPNMLLQPLVENAIKHGIGPRAEGGRIVISALRNNGSLELQIKDDGLGIASGDLADLNEGVGLSNTRRRLRHLYGERHQFELKRAENDGISVVIKLPFREANA